MGIEFESVISDENYAVYLAIAAEQGVPAAEDFYSNVMDHAAMERNIAKRDKK
jgi:hypothetical protein